MKSPACASCAVTRRICAVVGGRGPETCPTLTYTDVIERANREYERVEVREFARAASTQEAECYQKPAGKAGTPFPMKTRVQEVCEFARRTGFQRLGIAFCSGLVLEARALAGILEAQGFDVASVMCKAGGTPRG